MRFFFAFHCFPPLITISFPLSRYLCEELPLLVDHADDQANGH